MKISTSLIALFVLFIFRSEVEAQNNPALYNHEIFLIKNDSALLESINETIKEDLYKKDIVVLLNNSNHVGFCFELNAISRGNKKYGLHYYGRPYRVVDKRDRFKITIQTVSLFKKNFSHWEYHFIGLTPETTSGIYAIYELSDKTGDIQIIKSKIEILDNSESIIEKVYSRW